MDVLRTRTLEIIYDLFIWDEADFEFFDSEPLPDDLIRIRVEATTVIMDGIYRIDEWSRFGKVIPSDRAIFELQSGWTHSIHGSKESREVLYYVEKRLTAGEICFNLHTSLFHTYALLFALKLPRTVPELLQLARTESRNNDVKNALVFINRALDQEPKNAEAQSLREE